jgi:hypothetical protein
MPMRALFLSGLIYTLVCLTAESTVFGAPYARPGPNASDPCGCSACCDNCCAPTCRCPPWYLNRQEDNCGDCGYPCRWPFGQRCDPCCNPCRPMTCHDRTYCGPLTPLFALFYRDAWCGRSCGERYWGDFYSDPPDWCDPCDRCGNYVGGGNGWSGGGRNCCGNGQGVVGQMAPMEGRVISQGNQVMEQVPTPAPKPKKATKP